MIVEGEVAHISLTPDDEEITMSTLFSQKV